MMIRWRSDCTDVKESGHLHISETWILLCQVSLWSMYTSYSRYTKNQDKAQNQDTNVRVNALTLMQLSNPSISCL